MIYNFYIFGRGRKCLCREEWNRTKPCPDVAEETKLISGLLLTLKSFTQQISPTKMRKAGLVSALEFVAYTTPQYKLHAFDTASGYRFVLTTDPGVLDQKETLTQIYDLFVEHVIKNPLYRSGEEASKCAIFHSKLHNFIETRPFFATIAT